MLSCYSKRGRYAPPFTEGVAMNCLFCHIRQANVYAAHYKQGAIVGVSFNGKIYHYRVENNFFVECF